MNFNANVSAGSRQPFGRKVKRVIDVNAMGYSPYPQQSATTYPNGTNMNTSQQFAPEYVPPNMSQSNFDGSKDANYGYVPNMYANNAQQPAGIGMFAQPVVQDMAMQYGQQLASTGKAMMQQEIQRYVPVSKLKYYFAVDTKYVVSKLGLLFFPFTHSDWSIKYEQDGPVQPRFELNAPDLYIPTMAYVTYVLVSGLVLGMQNRFSPEQIGIQASSALAWCLFELAVYSCTLYITNIQTGLRTLDLLAYSGYKFVGIIASILLSIVGASTGYYVSMIYSSLALAFFLVRALRAQVLPEMHQQSGYYGDSQPTGGTKRRLYFLLFVAVTQPILSWWLSFHLIGYDAPLANKI